MELKSIVRSKTFAYALYFIGALLFALVIFQAGVFVGFHKATFSFGSGERYYRAFGERKDGMRMMGKFGADISGAHGAIGKILKADLPVLIVETPDHIEKVVLLGDDTEIRSFRDAGSRSDLKPGVYIVAIGSPNDSAEIEARLIRIIPPPPDESGFRTITPTSTYTTSTIR